MKRTCVWPLCLGALLTCVPAKPQERTQVTLEDLVRASLDRNREVLALRQRVTQAPRSGATSRRASCAKHRSRRNERLTAREPRRSGILGGVRQAHRSPGKRKNRLRVADAAVALAQADFDQRSTQIAYEIEAGYLSAVYERERIAVLDQGVGHPTGITEAYRCARARGGRCAARSAVARGRTGTGRCSTFGSDRAARRRRAGASPPHGFGCA